MERSFANKIESLKLGDGEVLHGEGILAVTRALLRSGGSRVRGYRGALPGEAAILDAVLRGEDTPVGVPVPFTPSKREPTRVH